jgi:hypothetical protein
MATSSSQTSLEKDKALRGHSVIEESFSLVPEGTGLHKKQLMTCSRRKKFIGQATASHIENSTCTKLMAA